MARRSFPAQVFVLTESKETDQKEALRRVRELALSRCGVEVKATPWLEGRPALDEFLDNHRGVLDLIIRHRLACGMWCVCFYFFSAMFCLGEFRSPFFLNFSLAVPFLRLCSLERFGGVLSCFCPP